MTAYEIFQLEKYGNILPETSAVESEEPLKSWMEIQSELLLINQEN